MEVMRGSLNYLFDVMLTLRPGTVHLRIHPPIATAGLGAEAAESLAGQVRRVVAAGCAEAA